jgi:hypothetical protein
LEKTGGVKRKDLSFTGKILLDISAFHHGCMDVLYDGCERSARKPCIAIGYLFLIVRFFDSEII